MNLPDYQMGDIEFEKVLPVDYNKLKDYIEIQITIRKVSNHKVEHHHADFRKCTPDDFKNNGQESYSVNAHMLLCPSIEKISEYYKLNNGFME